MKTLFNLHYFNACMPTLFFCGFMFLIIKLINLYVTTIIYLHFSPIYCCHLNLINYIIYRPISTQCASFNTTIDLKYVCTPADYDIVLHYARMYKYSYNKLQFITRTCSTVMIIILMKSSKFLLVLYF